MKKILLAFFLTCVLFSAVAQAPTFPSRILALIGKEWATFSEDAKYGFVVGLYFGLDTTRQFLLAVQDREDFPDMLATYEATVPDIINTLNTAYRDPRNRKYSILEVLLIENGKNWWDTEE